MPTNFTVTNHGTQPLTISVLSDENGRLFDCIVGPDEKARVPIMPGISFRLTPGEPSPAIAVQ